MHGLLSSFSESGKVPKIQMVRYPTLEICRPHHSSPSLHELYQGEALPFEASVRRPTHRLSYAFSCWVQHTGVIFLGELSLVSGVSPHAASCPIITDFAGPCVNSC
jgi:hypothetical protein